MTVARRKLRARRNVTGPGRPGGAHPENPTAYPPVEGRLEPNTAALMDGAPPGGVSGRAGPEPDPKQAGEPSGPTETDTTHLPG
jgi:hypothetical protein